jgi:uncharacterized surface protein with fasciclin (FAS1) repeats
MKKNMKTRFLIISIVLTILGMAGCKEYWEDHYDVYPETVDQNVWEAMQADPEISEFVQILKQFELDTLFLSDNPYTLFVPSNNAVSQFLNEGTLDTLIIKYHISGFMINSGTITGAKKIQTLSRKFAFFEKSGTVAKFDDNDLRKESPLYLNGKYFVMDQVAKPLPNLYQYFVINNNILSDYIDSQDSIILDRERSKPIGFDEDGNTVYDTVSIIYNKFEAMYFPVKHEFRNTTATIVFPKQDNYREALNLMAQDMGIPGINNFNDIPLDWQNEVLMPHLLDQGVFLNRLEPEEFIWKSPKDTLKLQNIKGDSIQIFYTPVEKSLCSNGYAYNYDDFVIPDSLYMGGVKYETEWLLRETGVNRYAWKPVATVKSDSPFAPVREYISTASNDSIVRMIFPKGYQGNYSLEFETQKIFPRRYVMVVRTHMDIGGIYDIYVNDELVKTFDYYEFVRFRGLMFSVTGATYLPVGRFNRFDMYVDNIHEYGRAKVRFEYKAPGNAPSNGLVLDYIEFIPAAN